MKCKKCEQTFDKVQELRNHVIAGHPGYMSRIGKQRHEANIKAELHERAAWDVQPGMALYTGKKLAKARIYDSDSYQSRTHTYRDPIERLIRTRETMQFPNNGALDNAA